jgi:DNA-binding CsgD family transcriptional regulator
MAETKLMEPIDSPSRRVLPPLLRRSWYGLNQAFRRRIAHLNLTPDQFTVLRILLEGDALGLTQRELSRLMSSDPNTLASLLERWRKWITSSASRTRRIAARTVSSCCPGP